MRVPGIRRAVTAVGGLLLVTVSFDCAYAQAVEVGAGLAVSCRSGNRAPCQEIQGRVDAVHVSWWTTGSLVLEARAAHLDVSDHRIVPVTQSVGQNRNFSRSYTVRDQQRTSLQASAIYHFRDTEVIRPFIGGGFGSVWWRAEAFCESRQIDCQSVLPAEAPGVRSREWVVSFAAGVAFEAWQNTIVRFGLRDTTIPAAPISLGNENTRRRALNAQMPEIFLNVGYRW